MNDHNAKTIADLIKNAQEAIRNDPSVMDKLENRSKLELLDEIVCLTVVITLAISIMEEVEWKSSFPSDFMDEDLMGKLFNL